jgi:hypothetical protein
MEPIDSIIILLIGCTLTLFVLWIASHFGGTDLNLPSFIQGAYSNIWTYLTGAGGSTLLMVLKKPGMQRPNYLVWSFAVTFGLLVLAFGIALTKHLFPQPVHPLALLKFRVRFPNGENPILSFSQSQPRVTDFPPTVAVDNDEHYRGLHYFENVVWPQPATPLLVATATRASLVSTQTDKPDRPMTFCIKQSPNPPTNTSEPEIHMQCVEGGQCGFDLDDYGWAVAAECRENAGQSHSFFGLMTEVRAQTTEETVKKPGWRVPSLMTLRKMTDSERVGFTEFTIKSDSIPGVQKADSLRYEIFANGLPLYVDGRPPEYMLAEFDASKGLDFSFGMENLSFSGADKGCEDIFIQLEFLAGGLPIKEVQLARRYGALRDATPEEIASSDGAKFAWTGKYIKPLTEDREEVFLVSTTDLYEAMRDKASLDQVPLKYNGMDVVGVLRPPLDRPIYGVVIGLRQQSGQVKFTFDVATANKLLAWSRQMYLSKNRAFPRLPFPYAMKPNESGAGKLSSCGTKAPQS